ncbi:MAG: helix-turn-helix transcriptional regulator [Ilumatobacteraceae bacterium]
MDAASMIRTARRRAGLTLRELGERAQTSHSTLSAYESGRTIPNVDTLDRVLRAAGFAADVSLQHRVGTGRDGRIARGRELMEVLELAEMFPARHEPTLTFPKFGRRADRRSGRAA